MEVVQVDPGNRLQVKHFLELPFRLYHGVPQWVPPLSSDARRPLDLRRNPFYKHSRASFWLAYNASGQAIGRLAVLENRNHNRFNQEQKAFFTLFECEQDYQAADSLFEAAFDWARSRGLKEIVGPKGFSPLDGMGLLVKGFEYRPAFGIPYNLPYYCELIEAVGFEPQAEIVSGYLHRGTEFPQEIHRLAENVRRRRGLRVETFHSRSQLLKFVPKLQGLYNATLGGTSGNVPLTEDEARSIAGQLLLFANPKLIKVVMKGQEPVGFLFAYPDISAAVQRAKGRLFPLGWLMMLRELKRAEWVNINGAGILEQYRGLGGTALLFSEMAKSILEGGFEHADLVQVGVENDKMQRELRSLGVKFYKMHRLYERRIS